MADSISVNIYLQLREKISSGEYLPGQVLSEPQVAAEYGTSRTPAREAMAMLVNDGFLNRFPSSGYVVRRVDADEMAELQVFRRAIEHGIFESIIVRSPDEELRHLRENIKSLQEDKDGTRNSNFLFHMELARLSGNRFFVESLEKALNSAARAFAAPTGKDPDEEVMLRQAMKRGHIQIIDALLAHDLDDALEALDRDYERKRTHM